MSNEITSLNTSTQSLTNNFSTIDLNNHSPDTSNTSGYTSFISQSLNNSTTMHQSPKRSINSETAITNGANGGELLLKTTNTIETIKQWSKSAYKCTKQIICEKLGKTSRTIDPELEKEIENLREMKKKYENLLQLTRAMTNYFFNFLQTQKSLSECFIDLAQKTPELNEDFLTNADTQKILVKNGDMLINALNFFSSNLHTLCSKTMEDTLLTIRNYEAARLEFDAYRSDLETLKSSKVRTLNQTSSIDQTSGIGRQNSDLNELEKKYENFKERYERFRDDVKIKIKFLDENRLKVMQKQLILFHNAIGAYFSGNQMALDGTIKQFSVKLTQSSSLNVDDEQISSFLEQN